MRTIGVVTTSRADYGIFRPVLHAIESHPELQAELYVSGTHLVRRFGQTENEIQEDGFEIAERLDILMASDSPVGVSTSLGLGVIRFAQLYNRRRPDILLTLGDRYEMVAAALAALSFRLPVAHIHGGEATEGLIDESLRHSLTKMSHLHFTATERYRDRVIQLGEHPDRVWVSGAPSLDQLSNTQLASRAELEAELGLQFAVDPVVVTFHPVTLQYDQTREHICALLEALDDCEHPLVFCYPNADTSGQTIVTEIDAFVAGKPCATAVSHLGTRRYFGLLSIAAALVGNSSSGIIEAASFGLPVVDIGKRQQGRVIGRNVLRVESHAPAIRKALKQALEPHFRSSVAGMENPYGQGKASSRIIEVLTSVELNDDLLIKRFYDLPGSQ